jgi:hypothetical protein
MKFAIVIVLLFTLTANAQKASINLDSARTVIAPRKFASADTLQAITKLFARRRTGATVGLTISGISFAFLLPITTSKGNDPFEAAKAITLLGVLPASLSSSKLIRFSKKREKTIIKDYHDGKPLPTYIKRRLIGRYFRT